MKKRIFTALLACLLVFSLTGCKSSDYKEAMSLYEAGKYEDAELLFIQLEDYEDSPQMLKACRYAQALELMDDQEYKEAARLFDRLEDYEDSSEKALECRKLYVTELFDEGDYSKALSILGDLEEAGALDDGFNARGWYTLAAYLEENNGYHNKQTYEFQLDLADDGTIAVLAHFASDDNSTLVADYYINIGYNEPQAAVSYTYSMKIAGMLGKEYVSAWGREEASSHLDISTFQPSEGISWEHIQYEGQDIYGNPKNTPINFASEGILTKIFTELGTALEETGLDVTLADLGFTALDL